MNWQPIETAPKDGTRVLVSVNGRVDISFYIDEVTVSYGLAGRRRQYWYSNSFYLSEKDRPWPTHWMPLPEAIAATRETEDA